MSASGENEGVHSSQWELLNSGSERLQVLFSFTAGGLPTGVIDQRPAVSRPRASKASIEAMPKVTVAHEDDGHICSICLVGFKVGDELKETPCKHSFHGACIEKWMGMSTLCPLCRFALPAESEEEEVKSSDDNRNQDDYTTSFRSSILDAVILVNHGGYMTYIDEYDSETEEDTGGEWETSAYVDEDNGHTSLRYSFDFTSLEDADHFELIEDGDGDG